MSKLKKEEKIVMPKISTPQRLMIAYVRCMMSGVMLNLLLLHLSDHNQDKEHVNDAYGMDRHLVYVKMIEEELVADEVGKM